MIEVHANFTPIRLDWSLRVHRINQRALETVHGKRYLFCMSAGVQAAHYAFEAVSTLYRVQLIFNSEADNSFMMRIVPLMKPLKMPRICVDCLYELKCNVSRIG